MPILSQTVLAVVVLVAVGVYVGAGPSEAPPGRPVPERVVGILLLVALIAFGVVSYVHSGQYIH